jgi:CHAT domain-containing protein/Tfp pilus assembly protein PilF
MNRNISISLVFTSLLLTFSSYSQQNNFKPDYEQLYRDAEKLFNSANATGTTDSLAMMKYLKVANFLIKGKIFNETGLDSYLKSGILEMSKADPALALPYFQRAILVAAQNPRLSDSLLFQPFMYSGSVHYSLNNLDSAVYYYKKAESVNIRFAGISESERLYNKFGALYFETGDYKKSISYFQKALSIVEEKRPVNIFFVINYKNNIATALMKLGLYDQALEIFQELLKYPNPGSELLYNTGNTYFEEGNYPLALNYVRRVRNMDFERYSSLVKIFIYTHQYDSAQFYLGKARNFYFENKSIAPRITYGIIMKYSGDLKAAAGNNMSALKDYQESIISLDPSFKNPATNSNPTSFSGLQNFLFLFDALVAKATAFSILEKKQSEIQFLEQSLNAYTSALSLVSHIEKTYFSDDARLFLKTKINPATQNAVEVAIRLYDRTKEIRYLNQAFGFAENNKATVLQAGLNNLELSSLPGLPVALVSEEKKDRAMLAKLNIQTTRPIDSLTSATLQKKIHDIEISLANIQDRLDENSDYHNLKFYSSFPNMDSLQGIMKSSDEAILSYYYTSAHIICFYITKEGSGVSYLPLNGNLFSEIISLRRELQSPEASGSKYLRDAGSMLFKELLDPIYDKIKDKKRLIVIPYNEISYLPFELMVNPADGELVLKKFAISYNYSANFLTGRSVAAVSRYDVLAMAPFSGNKISGLELPALPYSWEEIKDLPGKKLVDAEATKMQFIVLSGKFPVIHLATHAVANDTNLLGSYIEFYGLKTDADTLHRLYEQEIYATDLKSARLVILSACETGSGLLVNGEGVISLSRAFSYAGCKSVITSLWKADEISTSYIARRLHHYLQNGLPIDEALQKAKLDYLESNEIPDRFKNPAYWAHLVLLGDRHPVVEPGTNWLMWAALVILLSAVILAFRKKINQA